jgi:D-sedoheptulose 7-phosphate isomerase
MNYLFLKKFSRMSDLQIADQFSEASRILMEFSTEENFKKIEAAGQVMVQSLNKGGKIYSCGNGGSMCDAMHFAEELTGRYRNDRKAIPAMSISDPSHLSCVSNDFGYDQVFSRFIEAFGQKGDVLLAISTSGNSINVLHAVETARSKGMKVVALTGKDGGKIAQICDIEIRAPKSEFADRSQEIHIKVIHALIGFIEANIQ